MAPINHLDFCTSGWAFRHPSDSATRNFSFIQDHVDQQEIITVLSTLGRSVHPLRFSGHWTVGTRACVMLYVSGDDESGKPDYMAVKIHLPTLAELDAWNWDLSENSQRLATFADERAGSMTFEVLGLRTARVFEPAQLRESVPFLPMEFKYGRRLSTEFRRCPTLNASMRSRRAKRQLSGLGHLAHSMRSLATYKSSIPGLAHLTSIQEGLILDEPYFPDQKSASAANLMCYEREKKLAFKTLTMASTKGFSFSSDMFVLVSRLYELLPPENECYLMDADRGAHNTLVENNMTFSFIDITTSCEPIGFLCQLPAGTRLCIHESADISYQLLRDNYRDYLTLFQDLLCQRNRPDGKPCSDQELRAGRVIAESLRSVQAFFVQGVVITYDLDNDAAHAWITEVVNELLPRVNNYARGLRKSYSLAKSVELSTESYRLALGLKCRMAWKVLAYRTLRQRNYTLSLANSSSVRFLHAKPKQIVDSVYLTPRQHDTNSSLTRRQPLQKLNSRKENLRYENRLVLGKWDGVFKNNDRERGQDIYRAK